MLLSLILSTGSFLLLGRGAAWPLSVFLSIYCALLLSQDEAWSCQCSSVHSQSPCCWASVQSTITAAHVAVLVLLVHHQAAVGDARPLPEGGFVPVGCCSDDHCLAELAHRQNLQAPAEGRSAALQGAAAVAALTTAWLELALRQAAAGGGWGAPNFTTTWLILPNAGICRQLAGSGELPSGVAGVLTNTTEHATCQDLQASARKLLHCWLRWAVAVHEHGQEPQWLPNTLTKGAIQQMRTR